MIDGNPDMQFLAEEFKAGRITAAEYESAVQAAYYESGDEYGMRVLPMKPLKQQKRGKKR